MKLTEYHKLRRAVQTNAYPGTAADLRTLQEQLRAGLMATGLFEDVEVDHTDNIDHLVIAMCQFPEDLSEAEIAERLETVWEKHLRYGFWEAHSTLVDKGQVELQGATRAGSNGHYATLHIVAQKAHVPAQRISAE